MNKEQIEIIIKEIIEIKRHLLDVERGVSYSFWKVSFPAIAIAISGYFYSYFLMARQFKKNKEKEELFFGMNKQKEDELRLLTQKRDDEKEIRSLAGELLGEQSYLLNSVYYFNKCSFICYFSKAFENHFKKEISILKLQGIEGNKEKEANLAALINEHDKFAQEYKDNIDQRNKANERVQDSFRKFYNNIGKYAHINTQSKIMKLYNDARKVDFEIDPTKAANIAQGIEKDSIEKAINQLPALLMCNSRDLI